MAVCPWKGQITEPTSHNPNNPAKPDCEYVLHHAYGYRSADSRQNVYYNNDKQAVYMTAALGVVLNHEANTQVFFGSGEADNERRNAKNNVNSHNDDVTALAMSQDRSVVVTGQRGPSPAVFVWDPKTAEKKGRAQLAKGARGIAAVSISADNKFFATVDMHNEHNVTVFDLSSGGLVWKSKGDTNYIYDVAFTGKPGDYDLMTAGKKHLYFWDHEKQMKKRGIAGSHGIISHQVCCWDTEGVAYSGAADGKIFVWKER